MSVFGPRGVIKRLNLASVDISPQVTLLTSYHEL